MISPALHAHAHALHALARRALARRAALPALIALAALPLGGCGMLTKSEGADILVKNPTRVQMEKLEKKWARESGQPDPTPQTPLEYPAVGHRTVEQEMGIESAQRADRQAELERRAQAAQAKEREAAMRAEAEGRRAAERARENAAQSEIRTYHQAEEEVREAVAPEPPRMDSDALEDLR